MKRNQSGNLIRKRNVVPRKVLLVAATVLLTWGCQNRYVISGMEGKYVPVTQTSSPDAEMVALVDKYKSQLEGQMSEIIGYSEEEMYTGKPESLLTNFTSDVMITLDPVYAEGHKPDLSLMNVSGHRAPVAQGNITVGDFFNTYSFENQLVVVRLKGKHLKEVFDAYARMGGAGISSTVKMHIKDKKVESATVHGEPIEEERIYTIVTLDYLAEGNSGMSALVQAVAVHHTGIALRDFMIDYVRRQTMEGKTIKSVLDQRITNESTND